MKRMSMIGPLMAMVVVGMAGVTAAESSRAAAGWGRG